MSSDSGERDNTIKCRCCEEQKPDYEVEQCNTCKRFCCNSCTYERNGVYRCEDCDETFCKEGSEARWRGIMVPIDFSGLFWGGLILGALCALFGAGVLALIWWLISTFGPSVSVVW